MAQPPVPGTRPRPAPSTSKIPPALRVLGALDRVFDLDALSGLRHRGLPERHEHPMKERVKVHLIEPKWRPARTKPLQRVHIAAFNCNGEEREPTLRFRL